MNNIFTNFRVKLNSCIRIANKTAKSDNHLTKSIAVHFQFLELSYFCDCIQTSLTTRSLPVQRDLNTPPGAVVAQLASARLSKREVPGSILGDLNVSFDFPLIRVAIALNTRKTEH